MDDDTTAQPATAVDTHLEHPELTPSHTAHQHFHHDLKPVSLTSTSSTTGVEQATHSDIYQQSAGTLQEVEELECQETVAEVTTTTASLETYQLGDAVDARTEQTLSHSENPTNTLPENTIEPTPYHPIDETLVIDEVNDIEPLVSEPDLQAQQRRASRIIEFERLIATIEPTDPALAEEEGADDNADADISIPLSTSTSFTTMDDDLPPSFLPHTEEEEEDDDELYIIDRAEAMEGDEVLFSADDATSPTSDPHDFFFNDRDRKHMSFSSTYSYIPFSPSDLATPATSFDLNSSETQREGRGRLDAANIHGTKDVFTETQKIAYVGLCCVTSLEIVHELEGKEASYARMSSDNWQRKLMRKLYRHMEVTKDEQTMIESLAKHDILPTDLVESFVSQGTTTTIPVQSLGEDLAATTTTVKSITLAPDSDPSTDSAEERTSKELPPIPASPASTSSEQLPSLPTDSDLDPNLRDVEFEQQGEMLGSFGDDAPRSPAVQDESEETTVTLFAAPIPPPIPHHSPDPSPPSPSPSPSSPSLAGSVHDESPATTPASDALDPTAATTPLIIDLRWTVICDLFLLCIAESNYDARSRVFLAKVAGYLWLEWHDVVAFERKVTEQLRDGNVGLGDDFSMSEEGDSVKSETERVGRNKQQQARRYLMIGLATLGGGLVLGLSAGLMAPVIGAGFGAILTTVGVSGTTAFLGGGGGIALITTGATVAGGGGYLLFYFILFFAGGN
ncbi:hypothetical protein BC936DRAFT_138046 [Jimgerdemannia flammicorona]|uniref:Uncharacterized protein n=1 Tax=Jimgerdemannia flammicorona TaxID=994334 RepID=A0A433CVX3_9FUNG|nr:hypothetical protein BC936DRAFT_138046 [Jimgerdemannia flammicorona]